MDLHVTKLVTNITSLDTRLALVESKLAQVVLSSDLASTRVADMTTTLDTRLSVLDSMMSVLTQRLPSFGHQSRAQTVTPSPLDTSPAPPAPPADTPDTMGPALLGSRGDSATAGNLGSTTEDSTRLMCHVGGRGQRLRRVGSFPQCLLGCSLVPTGLPPTQLLAQC